MCEAEIDERFQGQKGGILLKVADNIKCIHLSFLPLRVSGLNKKVKKIFGLTLNLVRVADFRPQWLILT